MNSKVIVGHCPTYYYKKPLSEIKDFDSVLYLLHARIVSHLNLRFKCAQYSRYPDGAYLPLPSANPLPQGAEGLLYPIPAFPVRERSNIFYSPLVGAVSCMRHIPRPLWALLSMIIYFVMLNSFQHLTNGASYLLSGKIPKQVRDDF